ncbi:MAG: isoprenylcysteine carboxylmethyltransferase family protein [Anaerolineae bacterium]
MFIYAVVHSIFATQNFKRWMRSRLGERTYEGLYRIGYNVFAVLTLLPISWLIVADPGSTLWRVEGVVLWVLLAIQAVGLIGFLLALVQIDLGRFAGISQLRALLKGEALPLQDEGLQVHGVYALVRHPLYLFSLMLIWALPIMTESTLALNLAITLYFVVGSRLEERRMVALFGQSYIEYQQRVPWLIPGLRWPYSV